MYTTKQAAERLGIKHRTARLWLSQKRFPNAYRMANIWIIPSSDIENIQRPIRGWRKGRKRTEKNSENILSSVE